MENTVDINIDEFLPIVPEDSDETSNESKPQPNSSLFKKEVVDLTAFDTVDNEEENKEEEEIAEIIQTQPGVEEDLEGEPSIKNPIKSLISKGVLLPFDDAEEDIKEQDYEELIEENIRFKVEEATNNVKKEFYDSLPQELKYAVEYLANGGKDLKSVFKALSSSTEVKELDPVKDAETIVQSYLRATEFGTDEEIAEQIEEWSDLGLLSKKSASFKEKLDKLNEKAINDKIKQQQKIAEEQKELAKTFVDNVYKALEKGELNGVRLSADDQNSLYKDITETSYQSLSGGRTNLLGHLLEKYQFVEPNLELVAEAVWLLKDPEGYKKSLSEVTNKDQMKQTIRKLKTEQDRSTGSSRESSKEENATRKVVTRKTKNIFQRN